MIILWILKNFSGQILIRDINLTVIVFWLANLTWYDCYTSVVVLQMRSIACFFLHWWKKQPTFIKYIICIISHFLNPLFVTYTLQYSGNLLS